MTRPAKDAGLVSRERSHRRRVRDVFAMCSNGMVGAAGFEPANAGIKTRCLRPLGDAPKLVRPAGIEPATPDLEGRCSIQLS